MHLTEEDLTVLRDVIGLNELYISADNIVQAGRLVDAGLCSVRSDYDGPQLVGTAKGQSTALRRKLVRRLSADEQRHSWGGEFQRI